MTAEELESQAKTDEALIGAVDDPFDSEQSISDYDDGASEQINLSEATSTLKESDAEMAASLDEIMSGAEIGEDVPIDTVDETRSIQLDEAMNDAASDLGFNFSDDIPIQSDSNSDESLAVSDITNSEEEALQKEGAKSSKSLRIKILALVASFAIVLIGMSFMLMSSEEVEIAEVYTPDEKLFPEVADVALNTDLTKLTDESESNAQNNSLETTQSNTENFVNTQKNTQNTQNNRKNQPMSTAKFSWILKDQSLSLRAVPKLSVHLDLVVLSQSPNIEQLAPRYAENMGSILRNIFYFTPRNKLALPEIRTRILRELQFLMPEGQIEAVQIRQFELKLDSSP